MAYAILKHESLWGPTGQAMVQQWALGRPGRRRIVKMMDEIVASPELARFLESLDCRQLPLEESVWSHGWWEGLCRIFCCALPARLPRLDI